MKILSIETSCDETAVAVLDASGTTESLSFSVLGNALYSQARKHAAYGGVYPSLAKREHAANLVPLLITALDEARLSRPDDVTVPPEQERFLRTLLTREEELFAALIRYLREYRAPKIDAIAVTQGPGLEPALWVGINFARALATVWDLPIIPVNHLEGHLAASAVQYEKDTKTYSGEEISFPALGVIISGGHTELIHTTSWGSYAELGSTRDDSIGEAYDKVARLLNLPYPGGPALAELAAKGRSHTRTAASGAPSYTALFPRPMLHSGNLDFSFSGLKTAVLYYVRDKGDLSERDKEMIAAAFEEAVCEVVVEKARQALEAHPAQTVLVGGGVSANKYLRKNIVRLLEKSAETTLRLPAEHLSTDNAIMIGMAAYLQHLRGEKGVPGSDELSAKGSLKLEESVATA